MTCVRALVFSALLLCADSANAADPEVCFTPGEDCTSAVVHEVGEARHSILVQAYSFTSTPIAKALLDAKKRGVDVRAILDKSQRTERYSSATFLANSGIPVWIDDAHTTAHNKVIVIDGETVITGSFNFTRAAQEKNAENVIVIRDRKLAEKYAANWRAHLEHSRRYVQRSSPSGQH